jgi:hypothetical protein
MMERPRRTRRRVLREFVSESDILAYSISRGWVGGQSAPRDVTAAIDHEVQWPVANELVFAYLESYLTNDGCIVAMGPDAVRAEGLMQGVEADLEAQIFGERELLDRIETDDLASMGRALIQAGLGAPLVYDQSFFDSISVKATSHTEFRIREIAICSTVYMEWPEFVPLLRSIMNNDEEERVRVRAQIVLNAYIAAGLGGES